MHGVFLLLYLCLLAFAIFDASLLNGDDKKKAVFKEISDDKSLEEGSTSSMFHKSFHQCSIEDSCSFVIKNLKTNGFKKVYSEKDLPKDRRGFRVWQKYQSSSTEAPDFGTKKELMRALSMSKTAKITPKIIILSNGKPTSQSTTAYGNVSFYGVDGKTDTCFSTEYGVSGTWWMVDFIKEAFVIGVAIRSIPRGVTTCRNLYSLLLCEIDNFHIRVGNQKRNNSNPLLIGHAVKTASSAYLRCNPMRGRYLFIEWPSSKLFSICEVWVEGYYVDFE